MAPLGQPQRLTFRTYSDSAKTTLADPTTVTLYLKDPTGTVTPYTSAITHEGVGVFHYDVPDTTAGFYQYRWVATGAVATSTRAGAFSIDDAFPAALVSLEDAKAQVKPRDDSTDDRIQSYIYAASRTLLTLPSYRIADAVQLDPWEPEWHDGGSDTIILRHAPVDLTTVAITEYNGTGSQVIAYEPPDSASFSSYGFTGNGASGVLKRSSGGYPTWWSGSVKVEYGPAAASVPDDVREACLDLIQFWWTQSQAAGTQTYGEPDFGLPTPFGIPRAVTDKLGAYQHGSVVA